MSTRTQNRGRIRTANGVERQQNNQSGVGYNKNYNQNNRWNSADNDQRNSSKQDRNTSGWRKTNTRGNHASNNRDGTVPLWKTNEGRNSYAQSLGVSGPSRNRSQNQELFEVPGNRRGGARGGHKPPGAYNYNMYNTYNTEGRNWPQQEPASASLTNSQVPRHSQYNPATSRPGQPILDRFGSRENPVNISTARNLLQEEYDIQAAEYAAKNREKEIKKLQEKMVRLRFCSAYDLGHRLSDTRDISPEAREKMVQNLQAEYNNQAKIYAAQKKELEEKKAELERAKKIEKYQQSPIYRDVLQDQEQRPKESTGAVPKQKLNDNFYEKKKKYKSEAVSQPVSQPTVTSNQRTLMDAIDVLSKPSTSSNQKKLDTPVKPLILSRSKRTSTEFVTTGMSPAEFIEKVTGVSVLSKFVPSTSDSNLKEARKRMQEKLDEQLALKKKDEGKKKNESNENVKPSESSIQQPLPLEKADATTRCFSSQSSLNIDFKEIDTIQIPNLGKITTTTTTDNPVLVLRPLEVFEFKGSEAEKSVDDVSKKVTKETKTGVSKEVTKEIKADMCKEVTKETKADACKEVTNKTNVTSAANFIKKITKESKEQDAANTRPPSILEQLKLRAAKLDKEYEEQFGQNIMSSNNKQTNHKASAVKEVAEVPTSAARNPPLAVRSLTILDFDQINEYDRTGIVPQTKRQFSTRGCDCWGQPVLKLRLS